jgi:hypothetical protein
MSRLNAMMEQYQKNATPSKPKQTESKKYNVNNYFGTRLPNGVNSAQFRVRIIEPKGESESPLVETMGHKKLVDGEWKTFMCPKAEDGTKCPFCEARDILLSAGTKEAKTQAAEYSAKKMYITKLVDRENPEHGMKYWRFNHHYKNAGTYDKIYAALSALPKTEDPYSSENGRDMIISVSRDGKNSVVSGINFDFSQTPLSDNPETIAELRASADNATWRDVYSVKPYEYLEIIVRGGSPIWQKNEGGEGGKWIDKASLDSDSKKSGEPEEEFDSELSLGGQSTEQSQPETITPASESAAPEPTIADEDDDDLPF